MGDRGCNVSLHRLPAATPIPRQASLETSGSAVDLAPVFTIEIGSVEGLEPPSQNLAGYLVYDATIAVPWQIWSL